jgi:hypothetical protein
MYSQPSTALNYVENDFDVISYDLKLDLTAYPLTDCIGVNKIRVEKNAPTDFYFHLKDLEVDSVK